MDDSNGTFINDTKIRKHILDDGDQVRFGRAKLAFHIDRTSPTVQTRGE
jgi:pSer/pThr/pTyr-binding forkhead associated (FHA) protein